MEVENKQQKPKKCKNIAKKHMYLYYFLKYIKIMSLIS